MKIALINPPLAGQINDFATHVPFQPVGLLYIASSLRAAGVEVEFIDCFGEGAQSYHQLNDAISMRGLWGEELLRRVPGDADLIGISCLFAMYHSTVCSLISSLKKQFPAPIVVGGDHASIVAKELIEAGADFVIRGEGERATRSLLSALGSPEKLRQIPGLVGRDFDNGAPELIFDLDSLPYPAYELLKLETYWNFGDAHGPIIGPYLDLVTSRGCPYNCNFCAVPALCSRKWRARSAGNVVDEIEHFKNRLGVSDYQVQDANFSTDRKRVLNIVHLLLEKNLGITYSLPCGIKGENILLEDLDLMVASGLHYLVIAPESGSPRVLELMNKKVDLAYMKKLAQRSRMLGLHCAASFIIGYPGENDEDRGLTRDFILDLTRVGVDEFAIFIMSPFPGAKADELFEYQDYDLLCVTPKWRTDFKLLAKWRRKMIVSYLFAKLYYHPGSVLRNVYNTVTGKGEIKGEMVMRRALQLWIRNLAGVFRS